MVKTGEGSGFGRRALLGGAAALAFGVASGSLMGAAPAVLRKASGQGSRSIHSGHSLTDSYVHGGDWPGDIRSLAESIGIRDSAKKLVKSTIPGSPMFWRWDNRVQDLRPHDASADARFDIAAFDTLMITEGGPPPRVPGASGSVLMTETLDPLCRFAANAIENGNDGAGATDIILWSIWPSLTMWRPEKPVWTEHWQMIPDFRSALDEYGLSFRYMADYASWKLKRLYPGLAEDWRVWLFPGHLWMARVWDDIAAGGVPGISDIAEIFDDDIHTNDIGRYGLASFVITCLYQTDLRGRRGVFSPAVVSAPLRDYFLNIAWELATEYGPVGMGGAEAVAPLWLPEEMVDTLPDWTLAAHL